MDRRIPIVFHVGKSGALLPNRGALKAFIERLLRKKGLKLGRIDYIFVSDAELRDMNRRTLKHDYFTDILTFPLSDPGAPVESEIYLSVDRVRENAREYGQAFSTELHRVIFHGALHLCGYRDKTTQESTAMRALEDKQLSLYFKTVPRGTSRNSSRRKGK